MARLHHVKRAAKDYPEHGIRKGEPYYWWKHMTGGRGGPKHFSKTQPRRSALTQSEFLGTLWDIEDDLNALTAGDSLEGDVSDIVQRLRDLAEETEGKKDNMPEGLQESDTGQLLEDRATACNEAADELENITFDPSERDEDTTEEEYWQEKLEEVQGVNIDAP